MNKIPLSDTKIDLTIQQQDWLRTVVLPWIESRGILFQNQSITVEYPKDSGEVVFIFDPYDLVFQTLENTYYYEHQKETLNLLGVAYLWYKKEKIKWDGQ